VILIGKAGDCLFFRRKRGGSEGKGRGGGEAKVWGVGKGKKRGGVGCVGGTGGSDCKRRKAGG